MKKTLILVFFIFLTGCADKVNIEVKKVSFLCNFDKYKNYKALGGIGENFRPHDKGIFAIELLSSKTLNKYPNVQFHYKNIPNHYDWEQNMDKKLYYSPYIYFNPINPKELLVFTYKYNFKLKDIKTETFHINAINMILNELESNLFQIKSKDLIEAVKKAGFKELSENMCR